MDKNTGKKDFYDEGNDKKIEPRKSIAELIEQEKQSLQFELGHLAIQASTGMRFRNLIKHTSHDIEKSIKQLENILTVFFQGFDVKSKESNIEYMLRKSLNEHLSNSDYRYNLVRVLSTHPRLLASLEYQFGNGSFRRNELLLEMESPEEILFDSLKVGIQQQFRMLNQFQNIFDFNRNIDKAQILAEFRKELKFISPKVKLSWSVESIDIAHYVERHIALEKMSGTKFLLLVRILRRFLLTSSLREEGGEVEELSDIFETDQELWKNFFPDLPAQLKAELSERVFADYSKQSEEKKEFDSEQVDFMYKNYQDLLVHMPKKVGLLDENTASAVYNQYADVFLENCLYYRENSDNKIGKNAVIESAEYRSKSKKDIEDFFLYNPSKTLLKHSFHYWNNQTSPGAPKKKRAQKMPEGTKVKLITDRELNSFNWVLNNQPKTGQGRDMRRRLHLFATTMVERRIQREDDPVLELMGNVLINLKKDFRTSEDSQHVSATTEQHELAVLFSEWAMIFASLAKNQQKTIATNLKKKLSGFQTKKKENFDAAFIDSLIKNTLSLLWEYTVKNPQTLTKEDISSISEHLQNDYKTWEPIFGPLIKYMNFQRSAGVSSVERYLKTLSKSQTVDGKFKNIPWNESFSPATQEWFGENLTNIFQADYEVPVVVDMASQHTLLTERYENIKADMLTHLSINPKANHVIQISKLFGRNRIMEAGSFFKIFSAILDALSTPVSISKNQVEEWKRQLAALPCKEVFPAWSEFLINFDQIIAAQTTTVEGEVTFRVTKDPVEFLKSAEEPVYTCQRINEITVANLNGEPITRAGGPQFILSQCRVDGKVAMRSVLEIARDATTGKKVLLIERIYSKGGISKDAYNKEIIKWAKETGEIDFVCGNESSKDYPDNITSVSIEFLEKSGIIYRDTQWDPHAKYKGVDIKNITIK